MNTFLFIQMVHGMDILWLVLHSSDQAPFMVDPLSYFSLQPIFHDWCIKDRSMCYPVCGVVHIKDP